MATVIDESYKSDVATSLVASRSMGVGDGVDIFQAGLEVLDAVSLDGRGDKGHKGQDGEGSETHFVS